MSENQELAFVKLSHDALSHTISSQDKNIVAKNKIIAGLAIGLFLQPVIIFVIATGLAMFAIHKYDIKLSWQNPTTSTTTVSTLEDIKQTSSGSNNISINGK